MKNLNFRPYRRVDYEACTDIFDANCPEFFHPGERRDYERFLEGVTQGYEVCEVDGRVCGAYGLLDEDRHEKHLNWILLDPQIQGLGIGLKIMERVIHLGRIGKAKRVRIAASQKSAPFFARFGARVIASTKDGWGEGMDRIDMVLSL